MDDNQKPRLESQDSTAQYISSEGSASALSKPLIVPADDITHASDANPISSSSQPSTAPSIQSPMESSSQNPSGAVGDPSPEADTLTFQDGQIVQERSSAIKLFGSGSNFEREKTVISQRPVAAPHEFYRSVPLGDLAEMLEGRKLDHFLVQQIIGGGGMGAVFRGVDQRLDRIVAIKVIPGSKREPETLRRFQVEAQAAARLDHPNIARVFYVGESEQWNYIVFEYIEGINIRDLVELEGPMSIDDAVFYTRQIAEALQHAHDRDVVHRDIKPSNILVTPTGMAKLVDMGLARDTSLDKSTGDQTASGVTLGTFDYISPEQARNPRDADVRSDLYSLGCTLFYMLTGNPPFPEGTALQKLLNHGSLPPPDPRGWREDISDQLYDILMKLMAKRPADRYQRPIELVSDLLILAEHENLPRSQGPSTITLNPSIAQPTLLETHLPWLVAALVLFGSTLWLHSQMSLSTGFAFPAMPASEPLPAPPSLPANIVPPSTTQNAVAAESNSARSNSNPVSPTVTPELPNSIEPDLLANPSTSSGSSGRNAMLEPIVEPGDSTLGSAGTKSPSILIVSSSQPPDVPTDIWEPSLARAIDRIMAGKASGEIEIRGTVTLDRPVEVGGPGELTIRGLNSESRIEVAKSVWSNLTAETGLISVADSSLVLKAIQLRVNFPETGLSAWRVFELVDDASLNCSSVEFTLQSERIHSAFLATAGDTTGGGRNDPSAIKLTLSNCMVRGSCSLFRVNQTSVVSGSAVQVSVNNCVVAIKGRVIDLLSATSDQGVERIVRFFCDRTTFVASDGFAQLEYAGNSKPAVGFNRTGQACVFWSAPDVPHIRIMGGSGDPSDNPDQLLLQGTDNAYDQNLEHLVALSRANTRLSDLTILNGQQDGWYVERSTERVVRWKSSPQTLSSFLEVRPIDFQLISSHFVPGYRTPSPNTP